MKDKVAKRFVDEDVGSHWRVDSSISSFERLLYHIEVRSNFKIYFEEAFEKLNNTVNFEQEKIKVADIGAGVGWSSAIMAQNPRVTLVYSIDPSENRLRHNMWVAKHFQVENKVRIIKGTFQEPNVPEKVDLILLCASLHHCFDDHLKGLFASIRQVLKPNGVLLVANDHYVNWWWSVKRFIGYFRKLLKVHYTLGNLRAPDPFGGEHWRTKKELDYIFHREGFKAKYFLHEGDLCKDKPTFYHRLGWCYYYAILKRVE